MILFILSFFKTKYDAKSIAYGAIKYSILKVSHEKNVVFNWESALNFEGESSPYMQYAHARASSILSKTKPKNKANLSLLNSKEEILLIKKLEEFPEIINSALASLKPSLMCNYAYELAKLFTNFYHNNPVLKAEESLKEARLSLVYATKIVLKNSLSLLGIESLERM